ncbi:MAG: helix-turn-helix domain-containing protein [Vicinamibacteraceae bacterium]
MKMSELFELVEAAPDESNLPLHVHDQHLGRFVRRRREELGLSQAELGRRSGLSVKHLDHIEQAKVEASVNALERLAQGLRIDASELLRMVDESPDEVDPPLEFRDWVRLKEDLEKLAIYVDWMVAQGPS